MTELIDLQSHTDSGRYPLQGVKYIPNIPPTPRLKYCRIKSTKIPPPFTENTCIIAASKAIDNILYDLSTCVKELIWPPELDFPINTGDILILPDTKKNKPFIKRLRKINDLWWRLDAIPTHNYAQLEAKHRATDLVIRGYLRMMNEHILNLHAKFVEVVNAAGAALDDVCSALISCVKKFKYPSELDFPANAESPLLFIHNEKSQSFIDQLYSLDMLRTMLDITPTHGNEELRNKHRSIGAAIKREFQRMKEHQLKLWEKFVEAKKAVNTANAALDAIYNLLNNCVKEFRYPPELDFPGNAESPMIFISNEKSKPFIDQLSELNGLRIILTAIPTHGNEQLKKRQRDINMAISNALQGMAEHQLKLYTKRAEAYKHGDSYHPCRISWLKTR